MELFDNLKGKDLIIYSHLILGVKNLFLIDHSFKTRLILSKKSFVEFFVEIPTDEFKIAKVIYHTKEMQFSHNGYLIPKELFKYDLNY